MEKASSSAAATKLLPLFVGLLLLLLLGALPAQGKPLQPVGFDWEMAFAKLSPFSKDNLIDIASIKNALGSQAVPKVVGISQSKQLQLLVNVESGVLSLKALPFRTSIMTEQDMMKLRFGAQAFRNTLLTMFSSTDRKIVFTRETSEKNKAASSVFGSLEKAHAEFNRLEKSAKGAAKTPFKKTALRLKGLCINRGFIFLRQVIEMYNKMVKETDVGLTFEFTETDEPRYIACADPAEDSTVRTIVGFPLERVRYIFNLWDGSFENSVLEHCALEFSKRLKNHMSKVSDKEIKDVLAKIEQDPITPLDSALIMVCYQSFMMGKTLKCDNKRISDQDAKDSWGMLLRTPIGDVIRMTPDNQIKKDLAILAAWESKSGTVDGTVLKDLRITLKELLDSDALEFEHKCDGMLESMIEVARRALVPGNKDDSCDKRYSESSFGNGYGSSIDQKQSSCLQIPKSNDEAALEPLVTSEDVTFFIEHRPPTSINIPMDGRKKGKSSRQLNDLSECEKLTTCKISKEMECFFASISDPRYATTEKCLEAEVDPAPVRESRGIGFEFELRYAQFLLAENDDVVPATDSELYSKVTHAALSNEFEVSLDGADFYIAEVRTTGALKTVDRIAMVRYAMRVFRGVLIEVFRGKTSVVLHKDKGKVFDSKPSLNVPSMFASKEMKLLDSIRAFDHLVQIAASRRAQEKEELESKGSKEKPNTPRFAKILSESCLSTGFAYLEDVIQLYNDRIARVDPNLRLVRIDESFTSSQYFILCKAPKGDSGLQVNFDLPIADIRPLDACMPASDSDDEKATAVLQGCKKFPTAIYNLLKDNEKATSVLEPLQKSIEKSDTLANVFVMGCVANFHSTSFAQCGVKQDDAAGKKNEWGLLPKTLIGDVIRKLDTSSKTALFNIITNFKAEIAATLYDIHFNTVQESKIDTKFVFQDAKDAVKAEKCITEMKTLVRDLFYKPFSPGECSNRYTGETSSSKVYGDLINNNKDGSCPGQTSTGKKILPIVNKKGEIFMAIEARSGELNRAFDVVAPRNEESGKIEDSYIEPLNDCRRLTGCNVSPVMECGIKAVNGDFTTRSEFMKCYTEKKEAKLEDLKQKEFFRAVRKKKKE